MLTVITPTCDRPMGIALLERWMERQTVQPNRWIVSDGGRNKAALTMGQEHIHLPSEPGARNFTGNLLRALDLVDGGAVVVMEDDDWYAPEHIERCAEGLEEAMSYGCSTLKYFNLPMRSWQVIANPGASLAQTATRDIEELRRAAHVAFLAGDYKVDKRFWRFAPDGAQTVIGIKGLPGTKGLGLGHKPGNWNYGPDKLREWIGEDANAYI